jgi:hypothetical protein
MDTPLAEQSIAAVMLKRPSPNAWVSASWSLLGSLPGLSELDLSTVAEQGELHIIADLSLKLYVQHCDAYYVNLTSQQPKIYFVCLDQDDVLKPILITLDFDEAAAYMETGERVFDAPLSEALCLWLEQFVLQHYQPEAPKKRKRKNWTEATK